MATIADYKKQWNDAYKRGDKQGMAAAHAGAEAIRAKEGYSGGSDGSARISLGGNNSSTGSKNSSSSYKSIGTYNDAGLSASEKAEIENYKNQWNDAYIRGDKEAMNQAHLGAEAIRNKYNYTGGSDGSGFFQTGTTPSWLQYAQTISQNQYGNQQYSDYDSLLRAYEQKQQAILEQQQKALQQQIAGSVNNLEAQKRNINSSYDDAARQAYITKMQNQKALPEQLAAQGHNGGMSETANLSIGANYQNNLANINNSRNEALNGIDTEINNVKSAGSIEAAQLAANSAQSALDVYLQLAQQKIAEQQQAQSEAKSEFANTIGAYSDDYMKEIQRIQKAIAAGDSSESWKIPYLTAARNEKIAAQQAAVAEAQQQDFENQLNLAKANAYIYNQYN